MQKNDMKGSSLMSEYTSTVLENQVSFFDDSDNMQDMKDTREASDQHSENAYLC